jgi:hypothetical protein
VRAFSRNQRIASAKVFNATELSGCVLWLDSSDLRTITKDSSNRVSQISDKSNAGSHAVQSSDSLKPVFTVAVRAGKPILRFDGAAQYLLANGASSAQNGTDKPTTIFAVVKAAVNNANMSVVHFSRASVASPQLSLQYRSTNAYYFDARDDSNTLKSYSGTDTISLSFDLLTLYTSGTTATMQRNGTDLTNLAAKDIDLGVKTIDRVGIGARFTTSVSNYLNGDIAEVLIYNRELTTAEINAVNAYLKKKWLIS